MSNIAFIGLGNMGSGMCANLAKAGHQVHAFDLSTQSVENAVQAGALATTSIAECVRDAEFVITMLPAGKHVHAVYFDDDGVLAHADNSALLIDCSTIAVDEARSAQHKPSKDNSKHWTLLSPAAWLPPTPAR